MKLWKENISIYGCLRLSCVRSWFSAEVIMLWESLLSVLIRFWSRGLEGMVMGLGKNWRMWRRRPLTSSKMLLLRYGGSSAKPRHEKDWLWSGTGLWSVPKVGTVLFVCGWYICFRMGSAPMSEDVWVTSFWSSSAEPTFWNGMKHLLRFLSLDRSELKLLAKESLIPGSLVLAQNFESNEVPICSVSSHSAHSH